MLGSIRVLHVEDSPVDAELIQMALAEDGLECELVRVAGRAELQAALADGSYDLILSDYSLPGFDGLAALGDAQRVTPDTPFVIVTGSLGEEPAVEILKKGATDFVLKTRLERLPQVVRRALREAEQRATRRRAEEALRSSENVLRQVIDLVPHFIFAKDESGRFILANQSLAEAYGTSVEGLLGKTDSDFARSEEEARRFRQDDLEVIQSGQLRLIPEEKITDARGTTRFLETLKIPFFPEGPDRPAVLGVAIDVTEQRRARAQIQDQAALLQMAPDAITVRDESDRVLFWNTAAERLYGWTAAEMLGRVGGEAAGLDAAKLDEARRLLHERGEWSGELRKATRNGQPVVVESRWALVRDEAGQPRGILSIDTDITERKALEAQLLRVQRLESIGTLAGGIAHDLNNVLSPIMMSLELLRRRTADERSLKLLAGAESSVKRGADLVRQVLTFARGVSGDRILQPVKPLFAELEQIVKETFPKSIQLRINIATDAWPVAGDPTQLHQILLNLCVNARDAMPHGGVLELAAENVKVDDTYVRMHPEAHVGPHVAMAVRDSGGGIPPGLLERIFEPFFTTKAVGVGTGLGLSTTLGIVRSHGGFISVYSEVNKGTTFKVFLPAALDTPARQESAAVEAAPAGRGEVILVVDDEAALREIAKETLESFGYSVLTAADGAEAVALFAARVGEIGAVVTDMTMPIMDGPSTIRALRRIDPTVRIIATSGREIQLSDGARTPDIHLLPKPFTAADLLNTLARVLAPGPEPSPP